MFVREFRRATRETVRELEGYIRWVVEQQAAEIQRKAAAAAEAREEALLEAREEAAAMAHELGLDLLKDAVVDDTMRQARIDYITNTAREEAAENEAAAKEEAAAEAEAADEEVAEEAECRPREALLSLASDLLSLRATCRDLEAKTRRPFTDANIASKTFLLPDEQSMEVLVEISRHPTFSAAIKTITLVPWQLREAEDHQKMRFEDGRRKQLTAREIRARKRENGKDHSRDALAEALATFARDGNTISIELAADLSRPESACGAARLGRVAGYSSSLMCRSELHMLAPEIRFLRTVLSSGCRIQRLALTGCQNLLLDSFANPTLLDFDSSSRSRASCRTLTALGSLQTLSLTLSAYQDHPGKFVNFINQARELKELTLDRDDTDDDLAQCLLRSAKLPHLCILNAPNLTVLDDDIILFVKRHASSLRQVQVRRLWRLIVNNAVEPTPSTGMALSAKVYADLLKEGIGLQSWKVYGSEHALPVFEDSG
ncbi:hypothetical protein LTR27_010801 [Elasticomyces elasticus]|nr:hypothetical protein LTR27_010801 [Elasticomyces elasticus]